MTEQSYIVRDADTGKRLAVGRDAIAAEEKALVREQRGHRVEVVPGAPLPEVTDLPPGYRLLPPVRLAPSTLRARPAAYWAGDLRTFPNEWGPWGEGHTTANVAHALHDRGMVEIAVPISGRGRFMYRRTVEGDRVLRGLRGTGWTR